MPPDIITTADKLAAVVWALRHMRRAALEFHAYDVGHHLEAFSALEGELAERLREEERHAPT